MAQIVGFVAMSHSPSWELGTVPEGPGARFAAAAMEAQELVSRLQPDALVLFGPDHFRNFFYDVLPAFCIGAEAVDGFGDFTTAAGPLPCAAGLGRGIVEQVMEAGFDPAISLRMSVDHGITQPWQAVDPELRIPAVPIMVNASGAPRPGLRRCFAFGQAVGQAIRASDKAERVVVIGSGGLSHWLPKVSPEDPEISAETRDYVINGRPRAREYNAARERMSMERRRSGGEGRVASEWDRWFLGQLESGQLEPILSLSSDALETAAGNGAHELRSWIAALGAWGGAVRTLGYEPVPRWVTGMGCVAGAVA